MIGHRAVFLGVALDNDLDAGSAFLRRMGRFHEVSIGRSWMNSASIEYLLRGQAAPAAVPQIALFRRDVDHDGGYLSVTADELLDRRIGLDEIQAFRDQGFPIRISLRSGT